MSGWGENTGSAWEAPAGDVASGSWGNGNGASAGASNGDTWGAEPAGFGGGFENGGDTNGNDGGGHAGGDRACFNCGEPGHNKAECPNPRVFSGACRRCGKEGHWSKECPEAPPEGPITCRRCGEEGHMVKECPVPAVCKNCGEEGHELAACKSARKVDRGQYDDLATEAAWEAVVKAIKEKDIDDIKVGVQTYAKSVPQTTYAELEEAFRAQDLNLWFIAIENSHLSKALTNMDLQGNLDKKYTVTYRFNPKPGRPRERELWPKSAEENMERLKDAGEVVNRGLTKCRNCDEFGHEKKLCPMDPKESQVVSTIKCYNCDGEGHRVRDCPNPRVNRFACKNCGKEDHKVADCPEPRSAADVECRKCSEIGHFSKDCPNSGPRGCRNCGQEGHMAKECTEPRNMATVQCRNCDEYGHFSKECPKPRDISRVKCSNCQEMGHFKSKCPNPAPVDNDDGNGGFTTAEATEEPSWGGGAAGNDDSAISWATARTSQGAADAW